MDKIVLCTVALIFIHGSYSYILLTANMEDVQSVLKQLTNSNVIKHFQQVWNRAAYKFKQELNKPIRRQSFNETKTLVKLLKDDTGVTSLRKHRGSLVTGGRAGKGPQGSSTRIVHGLLI
ncbi:PREDICTED: uncharacterized protein LOC106107728 [Papilio polytes]|uniref:uncharacterized protein LOC106107728 n=1 Tax=Papilio polytes TaxID=76194 RepID=UPI000675BE38|nr:PREDICTED: uncharacterized protein LOC106107728 [Papilio polytes]